MIDFLKKKSFVVLALVFVPAILLVITSYLDKKSKDCNSEIAKIQYNITNQYFDFTNKNLNLHGLIPYAVTQRDFTSTGFQLHVASSTYNLLNDLITQSEKDTDSIKELSSQESKAENKCKTYSVWGTWFLYGSLLTSLIVPLLNWKISKKPEVGS